MRLSEFFLPTMKENPREAEIVSHRLMLRAGMIKQMSSGIFAWLPLGLKVLNNIVNIVREEQNRAGAVELLMPTLQSADLWKKSERYDAYGKEMLRIEDRHGREMVYGPTNEEMVTEIAAAGLKSYKDLPLNLYHIQWKFRDEVRPRFGVMRGREFFMKDAYSFDLTEEEGMKAFNRMFVSYLRTFKRMGITAIPMRAETGPIGGDASYEFIVLAKTGESEVYCHSDFLTMETPSVDTDFKADLTPIIDQWTSKYAATEDVHDAEEFAKVPDDKKITARGIEVGQVFFFGTKYSEALDAYVQGADGEKIYLQSGSYGIGVSRLLGAIIEASHDDDGIIWPEEVAPFHVGLINLKSGNEATDAACIEVYEKLKALNIETLYDDTSERAGGKFGRMDLIGLPWQLTIGPRSIKEGTVELKNRKTGEKFNLTADAAIEKLSK